jgi:hypothetical protein
MSPPGEPIARLGPHKDCGCGVGNWFTNCGRILISEFRKTSVAGRLQKPHLSDKLVFVFRRNRTALVRVRRSQRAFNRWNGSDWTTGANSFAEDVVK